MDLSAIRTAEAGYELYEQKRESPEDAFGDPVHLAELGSASDEYDAELRRNGLVLAFQSNRLGSFDIFRSTRESVDDSFTLVEPVDALNSAYDDSAPAFSPEFEYVMFSSEREGTDDIFEAHWPASP